MIISCPDPDDPDCGKSALAMLQSCDEGLKFGILFSAFSRGLDSLLLTTKLARDSILCLINPMLKVHLPHSTRGQKIGPTASQLHPFSQCRTHQYHQLKQVQSSSQMLFYESLRSGTSHGVSLSGPRPRRSTTLQVAKLYAVGQG